MKLQPYQQVDDVSFAALAAFVREQDAEAFERAGFVVSPAVGLAFDPTEPLYHPPMQAPTVREEEIEFTAMRAQGPGGQNVNKVSSAVHLRFDIRASSLPAHVKDKLLAMPGRRVTKEGVLVLKSQSARSQEQNKALALERLNALVADAAEVETVRRPTRPTYGSKQRRLQGKAIRSQVKASRGKVQE